MKKVRAFIPQKVSNDIVLWVMELLSKVVLLLKRTIRENAIINLQILNDIKGPYKPQEYIENQARWNGVKFGNNSNMSSSGCGIIATYNALFALGEDVSAQSIVDLISEYEQNGAVLGGLLGTSSYQIEKYFEKKGYEVIVTRSREEEIINDIGECSDTVIATVYNNQNDIMGQLHTVSITKDEDGKYSIHNANIKDNNGKYVVKDNNGAGYDTLLDAINNVSGINSSSIYVIGISVIISDQNYRENLYAEVGIG